MQNFKITRFFQQKFKISQENKKFIAIYWTQQLEDEYYLHIKKRTPHIKKRIPHFKKNLFALK